VEIWKKMSKKEPGESKTLGYLRNISQKQELHQASALPFSKVTVK
jgi:hypothetical protein